MIPTSLPHDTGGRSMNETSWIAERMQHFDSSGIRKVFDLAAKMTNPINLSIGQPDFPVPDVIKQAAIEAIQQDGNGYALTQGMPVLREKLQQRVDTALGHADRQLFVSSGTSGGLVLAIMALINPGDEVIVFDPYFVMYPPLVKLVGGVCKFVDTYPDFRIDVNRVADAIGPKTKAILFNSPANPTGAVASRQEIEDLARLAAERNVVLISDEIYNLFSYDDTFVSPAEFNDQTLVIDGFSKTFGVTGWRVGFVHGPAAIVHEMIKLQQYTFVCSPQPFQWAMAAALDVDMQPYVAAYRKKAAMIYEGLKDHFELAEPRGAFYAFPKAPGGSATEFVKRAIENNVLIIPGNIFSRADTHFRLSYAAEDATIERGIEILNHLANSSG